MINFSMIILKPTLPKDNLDRLITQVRPFRSYLHLSGVLAKQGLIFASSGRFSSRSVADFAMERGVPSVRCPFRFVERLRSGHQRTPGQAEAGDSYDNYT